MDTQQDYSNSPRIEEGNREFNITMLLIHTSICLQKYKTLPLCCHLSCNITESNIKIVFKVRGDCDQMTRDVDVLFIIA